MHVNDTRAYRRSAQSRLSTEKNKMHSIAARPSFFFFSFLFFPFKRRQVLASRWCTCVQTYHPFYRHLYSWPIFRRAGAKDDEYIITYSIVAIRIAEKCIFHVSIPPLMTLLESHHRVISLSLLIRICNVNTVMLKKF